jgi:NitT/TauT family transport system substrate-binding protein
MRRIRKAWSASLIAVAATTGVTACASASAGGNGPAVTGAPFHLRVYAQTVVDDAPFFIALKNGYFKDEGLDVSYAPLAKTTLGLPALASGQFQVVVGGNYPTMLQADEGLPQQGLPAVPAKGGQPAVPGVPAQDIAKLKGNIRILVEGYSGGAHVMSVVVLPDSKIQNAAGLAHQKVAVNLIGGIQTLTLNAVLKAEGVNPRTVDYVAVPFPKMVQAMEAHQVAAADMLEPFLTQAEVQTGALEVADQLTGPTLQFPISGVFTTAAFVRAHPQVALGFQRAMDRAQALADANRGVVERELAAYIPPVPGAPAVSQIAPLINLGIYPASLDAVPLQRVADLMLSQHLLVTPLKVSSLLYMP